MSFNSPDNSVCATLQDGRSVPIAICNCSDCENEFFVIDRPEHQPRFCPYCGIKFKWYDRDGKDFNMNGTEKQP